MPKLSAEARRMIEDVADRHGVSVAAAETLLMALVAGGGSQAQFNVPELGGMGQWSRGGMVMVGDMFDNALKARVDALCSDLAQLVGTSQAFAPAAAQTQAHGGASLFVPGSGGSTAWWPLELGSPSSTGAQNDMRYAFFPAAQRLAISVGGRVTVYDTADHQLAGFSQQQSGDRSLSFTSQHGLVRVSDLAVVAPSGDALPRPDKTAPAPEELPAAAWPSDPGPSAAAQGADDVLGKIERLAELHGRGILTAQEFEAKKTELLGRL